MTDVINQLVVKPDTPVGNAVPTTLPKDWAATDHPFETESGYSARVGLWTLAVAFGGFLLWASLAPLDEGVPSIGAVAIDTKRKPVQHLSGGVVKEVLVREGDLVKEGQALVRMDDSPARAAYESLRQHYLGLRATEARLEAEDVGSDTIKFHPDLLPTIADPVAEKLKFGQIQLFESRREGLRADLNVFEETIQGQKAMLEAYRENIGNRRSQRGLILEELGHTRELVKEGFAPRNRQLELERMLSETNTALSDLQGNVNRGSRAIREIEQRAISRKKDFKKEVEFQLADIAREAQADALKLKVASDELNRTELKAPVSGQVMSLAIQSPGGVLQAGQKLMDIVPVDEVLLLEAKVPPNLIDHVKGGLEADIRFTSFAHSPQLVVQGKVESVSKDLVVEPTGSYYLARVSITPEGRKMLGVRQLQPGMQVEVIFKTGQRTLLDYLLHPLTKRLAAAMKEE